MKIYLLLLLLATVIIPAHAYIDPGTGSMLIYAVVGIVGALLFAFRGVFYKMKSKVTGKDYGISNDLMDKDLVFYSEGKQYWNVFLPVVEELDKLGKKIVYLTSSEDDEGLKYVSENVEAKCIGSDVQAAVFLNNLKAKVLAMTTPQLDIMTIKKTKRVKHYAHIVHACVDVGIYGKYAFDYFDSVLCSGLHQVKHLRDFETMRKTKAKQLLESGCTYFDILARNKVRNNSAEKSNDKPVILVAPTWNKNSLLSRFGFAPVKSLLEKGYKVILRPHPQMYVSQKDLIENLRKESAAYENLIWDENASGEKSMTESDILVSDLSGIIFDYAFIYKKPVISIDAPVITEGLEVEDMKLGDLWELTMREKLGRLVNEKDIANLGEIAEDVLKTFDNNNIDTLIAEHVFNFGKAGKIAAQQLLEISSKIKAE
jgi:hypothetical protein